MDRNELKLLQSYPLEIKIAKTKVRIREWVRYWGKENVYISFSGGKDSTVLLDLVRQEYPDIPAVFCDTGLEYPEIKEFVKTIDNVEIVRPKKSFKQVIEEYGYPIVSKEVSQYVSEIRHCKSEKLVNKRLYGDENGHFKLSEKWKYLLDAPFEISAKCCYHLKKSPLNSYTTKTGRVPFVGMLAEESRLRTTQYIRNGGCNMFEGKNPKSNPMSFWTDQDVLEYIEMNNLEIASCYGEIKKNEKGYYMDGVNRTGCIFCPFGVHLEKEPNKFQKLEKSHPKLYEYCIEGGGFDEDNMWKPSKDGLGFKKILKYMNVEYENHYDGNERNEK